MKHSITIKKLAILCFMCLFVRISVGQSPTWNVLFKKAEKKYEKGKFHKVEKKLKKLKKKNLVKKYNADSTLLGMAFIMEAKAAKSMARFDEMDAKATKGLELLETYNNNNSYAYLMGHLRAIDLYNDYGNHKKADSLVNKLILSDADTAISGVIEAELQIRKAFTLIENGYYVEAEPLVEKLIPQWESLLNIGYYEGPTNKADEKYKKELLVYLYAAQMRIQTERGKFEEAESLFKPGLKKANKLVDGKSGAYTYYKLMEAYNYYAWKNYKQAGKLTSRIFKAPFAPFMIEKIADLHILASLNSGELSGINVADVNQSSAFNKFKTDKAYVNYKEKLNEALVIAYSDKSQNNIVKFFSLSNSKNIPGDHPAITTVNQLAVDYAITSGFDNNFTAAEKFYKELESSISRRHTENSIQQSIFRVAIAGYYLNYSESPTKAFAYLKNDPSILPLKQLTVNHPMYQQIVDDLREYYVISGKYEYPIKLKREVITALEKNPNVSDTELGKSLVDLAKLETAAGYYKEAEINVEKALKLIRKDGEKKSEEYVKGLNNAAYLYGIMGFYDKAEKLLNKSASILKKVRTNNKQLKLESVEDLAFLYTRLGNYSETEDLLKEVIESKTASFTENSFRLIKPYSALGELHLIKGEYPQAEKYLRKTLKLTKDTYGDSTLIYAEALNKKVLLDLQLGVYAEALSNANKVLEIRRNKLRKNHILLSDIYQTLGNIFFYSGLDNSLAEDYFTSARDIVEKNFNNNHPLYAEAIKNIAYVKVEKGEYDVALTLLETADDIWSATIGNRNKSSGEVARLKGDIYHFKGDFKQARREYDKSTRYFRRIFNKLHPDYLNTKSRLAQAYYIEGDLKNAESTLSETTTAYIQYTKDYFPTLSEEEKAKFWGKIKPDFEFYNSVAVQLKDSKPKYLEQMYDFALITKGLLLNSSIKTRNSILNSGDTTLINLFEKWLANKEFLTSTLSQSDEDILENQIDAEKLRDETNLMEKQLSEQSNQFAESFEYELYSWSDIRKVLAVNEAAIEIIRFREYDPSARKYAVRYAALILTNETRKNPEIVLYPDGENMEGKYFNLHRNAVEFKVDEERSYQTFWKPIQDAIGDRTVVYLSPDGIYNQINLESLYMGNEKYVIDDINIRIVNSTKTLAVSRSKEAKKISRNTNEVPGLLTALLVGNPVYYSLNENKLKAQTNAKRTGNNAAFIPQLPGTEKEVKTISELLATNNWTIDYLLGDAADEKAIKSAHNRTLIHIATHGFFDENPPKKSEFHVLKDDNPLDRSGLLAQGAGDVLLKGNKNYNIDDGILTATEAMNLNFENTELVVLSACETGRGKIEQGEGVFGLQRSFLVAGADAIIMSLFKVSDEVTQNLMVQFYKYWLSGDEKRVAFKKAQLDIKAQYRNPIYWGSFTMIAKE